MNESVGKMIQGFFRSRVQRRRAYAAFTALAILVSITTAYTLVQPASTMEAELICGLEEHIHAEDCYAKVLICGMEEGEPEVSQEPEVPEIPEVPEVPEVPVGPEDVENPEVPADPEDIEIPEDPETPNAPEPPAEEGDAAQEPPAVTEEPSDEPPAEETEPTPEPEPEPAPEPEPEPTPEPKPEPAPEPEPEPETSDEDASDNAGAEESFTIEAISVQSSNSPEDADDSTSESEAVTVHHHTEACYETRLVCGKAEHQHSVYCYGLMAPEQGDMMVVLPDGAEIPAGYTEKYRYVDPDNLFGVEVYAPEGALPEGVELMADLLGERSHAYKAAEEALQAMANGEVPMVIADQSVVELPGIEQIDEVEVPVDEEPVIDEPVTEEPVVEEPVVEEPVVEEPVVEEPVVEEPVVEEPVVEEPAAEEPVAEEPVTEEPVVEEPVVEEPAEGELEASMPHYEEAPEADVTEPETAEPADGETEEPADEETEEPVGEDEAGVIEEPVEEEAAETVEGEFSYDGFVALDIYFVNANGDEVDPTKPVFVCINAMGLLPEDADPESVAVQHHAEVDKKLLGIIPVATDTVVETVADSTEETGAVEVAENDADYTQDVVTAFAVESFSIFTITYSATNATLQVNIVKENGDSIEDSIILGEGFPIAGNTWLSIAEVMEKAGLETTYTSDDNVVYTFKGAYPTTTSSTEVTYLAYSTSSRNGGWRYSTSSNRPTTTNGSTRLRNLYLVYSEADATLTNTIKFYYYDVADINDTDRLLDERGVKFTVALVDEVGGEESYVLPEGSVVPETYTYEGNLLTMDAAAFSQMGISIPGYTFKDGYAYFYWRGNFQGDKATVTTFQNFGHVSPNHTGWNNIGYKGIFPGATESLGNDYPNDATGSGYYAYDNTGTLRIVFTKVSEQNPYHVNYVNNFETSETKLVDRKEAHDMAYDGVDTSGNPIWYGYPTDTDLVASDLTSPGGNWQFAGWYKDVDANGNGTGDPYDLTEKIYNDVTYYAKWVELGADTGTITIVKSFEDADGNSAEPPANLASIQLTLQQYRSLVNGDGTTSIEDEGDPFVITLTKKDGQYSGTIDGVYYFTQFRVVAEKLLDSAGKEILMEGEDYEYVSDLDVIRNYGEATFNVIKLPSKSTATITLDATGYILMGSTGGGDWRLWMPYPPLNPDERAAVLEQIVTEENSSGPDKLQGSITTSNTRWYSASDSTFAASITPHDNGSVTVTFDAQSVWTNIYYGGFELGDITIDGTLTNIMKTGDLIIDKTVKLNTGGTRTGDSFSFYLESTELKGRSFSIEGSTDQVVFDNNGKSNEFTVVAGTPLKILGLSAGVSVKVVETGYEGYAPSWTTKSDLTTDVHSGDHTTVPISGETHIYFINTTGAALPSTGGIGTHLYTFLGITTMLGAGMLLLNQRRRKEGPDAV